MSGPQTIQIEIRSASVAKLENGYTRIANELLEALARCPFTAAQLRIIIIIARLTYGYKKRAAPISTRKIAEACQLKPWLVRYSVSVLVSKNVLFRENGQRGEIGINNHVDQWQISDDSPATSVGKSQHSDQAESAEIPTLSVGKSKHSAVKIPTLEPNTPYKKKENFKEKGKESATAPSEFGTNGTPYPILVNAYHVELPMLRRVVKLTPARKQALDAAWNGDLLGQNPAKWTEFFHYVATNCPFLIGQKPGNDGTLFESDLEWLMQEDHLVRIIEGKYEEGARHG